MHQLAVQEGNLPPAGFPICPPTHPHYTPNHATLMLTNIHNSLTFQTDALWQTFQDNESTKDKQDEKQFSRQSHNCSEQTMSQTHTRCMGCATMENSAITDACECDDDECGLGVGWHVSFFYYVMLSFIYQYVFAFSFHLLFHFNSLLNVFVLTV